jgi:hypothetical protein
MKNQLKCPFSIFNLSFVSVCVLASQVEMAYTKKGGLDFHMTLII